MSQEFKRRTAGGGPPSQFPECAKWIVLAGQVVNLALEVAKLLKVGGFVK